MRRLYKVSFLLALAAVPAVAFAHPGKSARFDQNGDGTLSDTERAAMIAARKEHKAERQASMLAKFDANKDGVLDDAERAAAKQERADAMFARLDVNKDGSISRAEFATGMDAFRGGGHGRHHRGGGKGGMRGGDGAE